MNGNPAMLTKGNAVNTNAIIFPRIASGIKSNNSAIAVANKIPPNKPVTKRISNNSEKILIAGMMLVSSPIMIKQINNHTLLRKPIQKEKTD